MKHMVVVHRTVERRSGKKEIMRIGMCQKDLRGPFGETLEWIASHGYDGFQVWQREMHEAGLNATQVLSMATSLGLEVTAVGGGPNLVDPRTSRHVVDQFRWFLDLSVELGCRIVTAESKAQPDDISSDYAWDTIAEIAAEICTHAEDVGAVLAIECSNSSFIADQDDWHELYRRVGSNSLKVNFDPANFALAGRDPVEAVDSLADHIVHTHAKDVVRCSGEGGNAEDPGIRDVPAGEGIVGYASYMSALARAGYDGYLTVEMHPGNSPRLEEAAKAVQKLRTIIEAEGIA